MQLGGSWLVAEHEWGSKFEAGNVEFLKHTKFKSSTRLQCNIEHNKKMSSMYASNMSLNLHFQNSLGI
jgi:hypothetical protein